MSISNYYETICKEPLLTADEERALMVVYKGSDSSPQDKRKARERLLRANLRYVFKTAKNYSRSYPSMFEDLISAGNEGLIVGLEKYNPETKNRFLTYAGWWVLQRILKEMSRLRLVSLPIWKQQVAAKIAKLKENDGDTSPAALKVLFPEVSERDLRELSETQYLTCFLDDLDGTDLLPVESAIEEEIDGQLLHQKLANLSEDHRKVVHALFGMDDGVEKSVRAIAKELGISTKEVEVLKKEALEVLRSQYKTVHE